MTGECTAIGWGVYCYRAGSVLLSNGEYTAFAAVPDSIDSTSLAPCQSASVTAIWRVCLFFFCRIILFFDRLSLVRCRISGWADFVRLKGGVQFVSLLKWYGVFWGMLLFLSASSDRRCSFAHFPSETTAGHLVPADFQLFII